MNYTKILLATISSISYLSAHALSDVATYPAPVVYTTAITSGGNLTSSNELYFATGIESAPLYFGVNGIKTTTNVSLAIKSMNIVQNSNIPQLMQSSCVFNTSKTKPCTMPLYIGNSDIGDYQITPNINGSDLTPINIHIVNGSSVTLPDGKYSGIVPQVTRTSMTCVINDTYIQLVEVKNGNLCFTNSSGTHSVCRSNPSIPLPNGVNSYINPDEESGYDDGYAYNTSWTGTTLSSYWAVDACPGFSMPWVLNKVN